MFSLRFATLMSKILSFLSKFYTHPAFLFWALIRMYMPFSTNGAFSDVQAANRTAPDALTHCERRRIYPEGHDAHVFQKEFHISDHRAVFQFLRSILG